MALHLFLSLLGLLALVLGSDLAVGAAREVARRMGISEWVVGLTVTAVGTSLPELATTARAALAQGTEGADAAGLAFANVFGSNLFMVGGLLGLSALLRPMPVDRPALRRDGGLLLAGLLLVGGAMLVAPLGRWQGALMVLAYVAWLAWLVVGARRSGTGEEGAGAREEEAPDAAAKEAWAWVPGPRWLHVTVRLVGGLAVVVLGADQLVANGIVVAHEIGVPGAVIGVLVGIGTSLPELVVSLRAASSGAAAMSLGNIIGSSITNLLLCLGFGALAAPLAAPPDVLRIELPFTAALTVVALLLMRERDDVSRREGGVLAVLFALYLVVRLSS